MQKSLEKSFSCMSALVYVGNSFKRPALRVRLRIDGEPYSDEVDNIQCNCQPLFVIPFRSFNSLKLCFYPHWFVVHVDHRTMKRNLAGEDLGKTRLRNWRGGAWRRIQTRTCRGELGCGEEGPRHHRQNSCDSNPSNEQWSYLASEPKPIILLCRRDSKAVACEVLSCVSKMSLLENLQLTPYQNRLVPVM